VVDRAKLETFAREVASYSLAAKDQVYERLIEQKADIQTDPHLENLIGRMWDLITARPSGSKVSLYEIVEQEAQKQGKDTSDLSRRLQEAVWKAALQYDPSTGRSFYSWLMYRSGKVRSKWGYVMQSLKPTCESLDKPVNSDGTLVLIDIFEGPAVDIVGQAALAEFISTEERERIDEAVFVSIIVKKRVAMVSGVHDRSEEKVVPDSHEIIWRRSIAQCFNKW